MFGKATLVKELTVPISIDGGIEIILTQVSPVFVTCIMDGSKVKRVHADAGIEFLSDGGFIGLSYKPGYEITDICNRAALERQIRAEAEENEAMQAHIQGD